MKRRKRGYRAYGGKRSRPFLTALLCLAAAGALLFAGLELAVFSGSRTQVSGDPKLMVVFGCKVEPWGPSELLRDRLDTALAYLEDHPDMTVVVTGGRGRDEPVSEARCMYDYLTAHGVDGDRILMEDRAGNTWENIKYTQALVRREGAGGAETILAVSNGFHLTRIRMLWAREWEGTYTLSTLAAPSSHLPSRLHMYVREPLALLKSFLFDR